MPVTLPLGPSITRAPDAGEERAPDQLVAPSRVLSSSGDRVRSAAAAESRIVSGREEPGIGTTTGEVASIQAIATCCGLLP